MRERGEENEYVKEKEIKKENRCNKIDLSPSKKGLLPRQRVEKEVEKKREKEKEIKIKSERMKERHDNINPFQEKEKEKEREREKKSKIGREKVNEKERKKKNETVKKERIKKKGHMIILIPYCRSKKDLLPRQRVEPEGRSLTFLQGRVTIQYVH